MSLLPVDAVEVRINHLAAMKKSGQKIVALTAYDYPTARLVDQAGVDLILVGDSVGNVVLGHANTLPVTMDQMVHHAAAVRRGVTRAFLVADMPFLSWQTGWPDAMRNAGRLLREAGVAAVKIEGAGGSVETIRRLVDAGIPVVGHLGYTPQSVHRFGSNVVQGKTPERAEAILEDAQLLEGAGICALVLECVPADLAERITRSLTVPTIGIGAGPDCDGQILVLHDLLGLTEHPPKFAKVYADVGRVIAGAVEEYAGDVREGAFPAPVPEKSPVKCA